MPRQIVKPSVARRIERLEEGQAELRQIVKQLTGGQLPIEGDLGGLSGGALRLNTFLKRTDIPPRTFYRLRDAGKLQVVIIGDRGVYVLLDSYRRYIQELVTSQNPPGAPPPNVRVTKPPVPRRHSNTISLASALPSESGPPTAP